MRQRTRDIAWLRTCTGAEKYIMPSPTARISKDKALLITMYDKACQEDYALQTCNKGINAALANMDSCAAAMSCTSMRHGDCKPCVAMLQHCILGRVRAGSRCRRRCTGCGCLGSGTAACFIKRPPRLIRMPHCEPRQHAQDPTVHVS